MSTKKNNVPRLVFIFVFCLYNQPHKPSLNHVINVSNNQLNLKT
jgi:hypothetical protein